MTAADTPGARALRAAAALGLASTAGPLAYVAILVESSVRRQRLPLEDLLFVAAVSAPPLLTVGASIALWRRPASAPAWPLAVGVVLCVVPNLLLLLLDTFGPADGSVLIPPCAVALEAAALGCAAAGAWTRRRARTHGPG